MTKRQPRSTQPSEPVDPDLATILSLVFAGISAGGWVIDFLERRRHSQRRLTYRRPAGRTVEVKVTTWSANLKELKAQFAAVQGLIESVSVDPSANPIRVRVNFQPAELELMRRQISSLTKLVRTSVDTSVRLMREATRGDYFELTEDGVRLLEAHRVAIDKAVALMWGNENLSSFMGAASTALSELNQAASLIETYILGEPELRDSRG